MVFYLLSTLIIYILMPQLPLLLQKMGNKLLKLICWKYWLGRLAKAGFDLAQIRNNVWTSTRIYGE